MTPSTASVSAHNPLQDLLLSVVSEQTQYKVSDLSMSSHLENELGVDSIALVEILATLKKRLGLGEYLPSDQLKTLKDILEELSAQIKRENITVPEVQESACVSQDKIQPIKAQVRAIFAAQTGYAEAELFDDAHLEQDIGVDSVNLHTILSDLFKRYKIDADTQIPPCETLSSVDAFLLDTLKKQFGDNWTAPVANLRDHAENAKEIPAVSREENVLDGDARTMRDFVGLQHPDLFHKAREFKQFYDKKKANNLYWYGMPLESMCKNRAVIFDEVMGKSREFLMFGSNSYLGLSNHPKVIAAIQDAAQSYGATNTGCRLIAGSNVLHMELEQRLAALKGREACIVYPSGYSANLGAISALTSRHDLVFTDAINHMSIQDGCKLAGAQRKIYSHSLSELERSLARYADYPGGKLIVTDGVFSMHGDIVDLPRLMKIAKHYGARVLVDDAHSTGVLGKQGSGTSEHFKMKGEVDLELGTMSKALSGLGGFVCGDGDVVEYLRFYSHSYVFAATIPAHVAAGVIASIDVMLDEPERLTQLWDNIYYFRNKLLKVGFDLEHSDSAIIPIVVGDDPLTLAFGRAVRARNMYCQTVVFPGVSVGDARLRLSVTSEHTQEDLDQAFGILVEAAQEVGVPVTV